MRQCLKTSVMIAGWSRRFYIRRPSAAAARLAASHLSLSSLSSDFVDLGLDEEEKDGRSVHSGGKEESVLGVIREPEVPEGQEYSRLNIPLTQSRKERMELRPNSRSAVSPLDGSICVLNNNNNNNNNNNGVSTMDNTGNSNNGSSSSSGIGASVNNDHDVSGEDQPLPYDDEIFAEMILGMEVDGAIDETWQDADKALIEDVEEIVEVLRSLKVRDICAIDVSSKTSNFDYMIFGSCEGPRHIHLAAWAVQEADSQKRISKIKRKQSDHTWEAIPVGRIIVNLMQESLREELSLERKWTVTKSMDPLNMANAPVSEGRQVRAHGLWTLTLNLQDLEDFEVDYCKDTLMRQL
ncbi:uncharacterized protein TM35_000072900 [Trypanosoma theileri]|uniref:Uncharacterized protein n=1 Tax=Trypanosoma theileri TaxID=67003 RepID=A0A1X0P1N7_9TRYP|nr:uncharacterized protein TM35_000072900 [Trypanosoma theileri]ORC90866.1 hypothetical protein TM35_000072900 [Trypanosoma theileri]